MTFRKSGKIWNNKKAMELQVLVGIILTVLALIGSLGILYKILFSGATDIAAQEMACMLEIRTKFLSRTGDINFIDLQCPTMELEDLGVDEKKQSREDIMNVISDKSVMCWKIFGEGAISSLSGLDSIGSSITASLFPKMSNAKVFCHICYDVEVRNIEGDSSEEPIVLLEGDFLNYFSNTVYEVAKTGEDCFNDIDDNGDGLIDCDDQRLCQGTARNCRPSNAVKIEPCYGNGGVCKDVACDSYNEITYEKPGWECSRGRSCCVSRNNAYSFMDYIRYNSGYGGNVVLLPYGDAGEMFSRDRHYAIAYMEPVADDDLNPSFIAIGDYNQLKTVCTNK